MVFFDTCVWIELCCAATPVDAAQRAKAQKAATLISNAIADGEAIVTCKEQLIEIISAVMKVKMREYNKTCKINAQVGVGNIKEYRKTQDFSSTQELCKQAISDVCKMTTSFPMDEYDVTDIMDHIHLVDINDFLYYQYCVTKKINFSSFDADFNGLNASEYIHIV